MSAMNPVPEQFAQTIREMYGARGDEWLGRLPETLAGCERRWSLRAGEPFPNLTYNYVAPAERADGVACVLKLGVPNKELTSEAAALRLFDGRAAVRLLEADADGGALLLQRVAPGTSLLAVEDDDRATLIAAEVMRALWRPAPPDHPFPTVARWAAGLARMRARFDGGTGPLPARLVQQAEAQFASLLDTSTAPVVLHGDLHHDNILASADGGWLAIDPKGVAGEPAYETGAIIRNPPGLLGWPNLERVLARRIHLLAGALGFEAERIRAWAFAQAVLSAWWSVEDHGHGWESAIALAERLAGLRL